MPDVKGHARSRSAIYRQVARIHAGAIDQGFLPKLGVEFLALLYEAIDADPSSAFFVETVDDVVVGFVAGGRGMGSVYRQLFRRWPRLVGALFPRLLNLGRLVRVLEILWHSRGSKPVPGCPRAELFSIAVAEAARGGGTAERLYRSLAQWFAESGEPAFCIVVGDQLAPAHRFYRRMGAVPMAQIAVHRGEGSTLYRHDLPMQK